MQIIQSQEPLSSIRQRALNEGLAGAINNWSQMEKEEKHQKATERQEALELMKTTQQLRTQGYDVNENQVKQYLAPEKTQSFGEKLKSFVTGEEAQPQVRPDIYGKRTDEYLAKQEQLKATNAMELQTKQTDLATKKNTLKEMEEASPYKRRKMELENQKLSQDNSMYGLEREKLVADIGKTKADSAKAEKEALAATSGKQLSSTDVLKVNEGNAIPSMLKDVSSIITSNADSFGPVKGRASSFNPYNEKAQTIESNIRASSQAFGRYMEGGVLRKEDEDKYAKMFPNLSDTPAIAANKLAIVEKLLVDKQNSNIEALRGSGYDTSGVDKNLQSRPAPEILGINGQAKKASPINHPEVDQAVQWARANPNDQRSQKILERVGG